MDNAGKTLDDKIVEAQHRIEDLYNSTNGRCFLSFSGGKDSTTILALIKMCEEILTIPKNAIPAVFCNTGVEMGVTVEFIRWVGKNWYENVVEIRPEVSFDWILKTEGKPIRSKLKSKLLRQWHEGERTDYIKSLMIGDSPDVRTFDNTRIANKDLHMLHDGFDIRASSACCKYLKKNPMDKYARDNNMLGTFQGVRIAEGGARELAALNRLKNGGKLCTWSSRGIINKAPLIDWTDDDILEFIKKYNVPLSKSYTIYHLPRTGCMGCPFSPQIESSLAYLYAYEPYRYVASMHWLKDVYIAQGVALPFDKTYMDEYLNTWQEKYEPMRNEMIQLYRPDILRRPWIVGEPDPEKPERPEVSKHLQEPTNIGDSTFVMMSLFSGSGGFELASANAGIKPIYASEIEPYPIAVTTARFPDMVHLGDARKIDGTKIHPVHLITFGSPCQDLSRGGNHAGLDGDRSGLFKEAIRIISEMREATNGKYPRYIVFENVIGAFSSNEGEDFRSVLNYIVQIKNRSVDVPKHTPWRHAGLIEMEEEFSLAWRVLDSNRWGVPQRRKRIFLVADFNGNSAAEILFKPEGLRRCARAREGKKFTPVQPDNHSNQELDETALRKYLIYQDWVATLLARDHNGAGTNWLAEGKLVIEKNNPELSDDDPDQSFKVRRLTPLEYSRLQGFPDWWSDIGTFDEMEADDFWYWSDIRNAYAESNGYDKKEFTLSGMKKYMNELRCDTTEFKM